MKKTMLIEGMMCGHCTGRVTTALNALEGVEVLETSVEKKHAVVETEVSNELLKEAVEDIGYDVIDIK
ncbi:heavy-metal-associated domain-containing protein [Acidaminobacter sp. JC074]|uniref:heavy-metal-associated domain-containing protein n=1 Tax=Acidaminobacter sp. JC074 TaxID=2530199 RepID=UPI001F1043F5|nr:heavy-metal-associated domain-containing protein [Acidaminobacter sp. JC074]